MDDLYDHFSVLLLWHVSAACVCGTGSYTRRNYVPFNKRADEPVAIRYPSLSPRWSNWDSYISSVYTSLPIHYFHLLYDMLPSEMRDPNISRLWFKSGLWVIERTHLL